MATYLVTYHPLIRTQPGRDAVQQYGLPPYIDASCRREPDFQSAYPSISALCRGRAFAPRLKVSDIVVYITKQGQYPGLQEPHWKFIAMLEILMRFNSHPEAAFWYRGKQLSLPSNCLVPGNPPVQLDQTHRRNACISTPQVISDCIKEGVVSPDIPKQRNSCVPHLPPLPVPCDKKISPLSLGDSFLVRWDQWYQDRVQQWGTFLVCKPLCPTELHNPPTITRENMLEIFGKVPATRNPPAISLSQFDKLKRVVGQTR